jgi:hypothetical protein
MVAISETRQVRRVTAHYFVKLYMPYLMLTLVDENEKVIHHEIRLADFEGMLSSAYPGFFGSRLFLIALWLYRRVKK